MNQDPFKKEPQLRTKMDKYHVEVPDFPMKPKKRDRLIHFLASPAPNPLEPLISTMRGVMLLKIAPLAAAGVLGFLQMLLF